MSWRGSPDDVKPPESVELLSPPARPRRVPVSVRLNIRGRSVRLRGLLLPPTGATRWLAVLGPGLIACAAGLEAGGIATFSAAGANTATNSSG